jgi:hypothetical protein
MKTKQGICELFVQSFTVFGGDGEGLVTGQHFQSDDMDEIQRELNVGGKLEILISPATPKSLP